MFFLLLLLLLVPSLIFSACFAVSMIRTFTPWSAVHWVTVLWGITFFIWFLPMLGVTSAIAECIAPSNRPVLAAIGIIGVPSLVAAVLLGLSTRSAAVAALTVSAGTLGVWLCTTLPFGMAREHAELVSLGCWLIIVCVALSGWVTSTLRAKPWRGKPLACKWCGYDLTGLPDPVCPECAAPLFPRRSTLGRPEAPRGAVTTKTGAPRAGDRNPW